MKKIFPLLMVAILIALNSYSQEKKGLDSASMNKDTNYIYVKADPLTEFPGGEKTWYKFLSKNIKAETPAKNGAPVGKYSVTVYFVINPDGTISDVNAENNPGYGTAEEAIRVIRKSPKWNPGIMKDQNIKLYRKLNIIFQLEDR